MQTIPHHLACGCARTLAASEASELYVLRGILWLTQSNDANDYFLGAGQTMALRGSTAVVQAEGKDAATYFVREILALQPATVVKLEKQPQAIAVKAD
jgi:hypothetical protein